MYLKLQYMAPSEFTQKYTDDYGVKYLMNPEPAITGLYLAITLDGEDFGWFEC